MAPPPRTIPLPYPKDSLHKPLTVTQRTNITKFLMSRGYSAKTIHDYVFGGFGGLIPDDDKYISAYNAVASGGGFGSGEDTTETVPGLGLANPLHGIEAVGDFFQRLTQANTWIRIGEFTAGFVLLAVGMHAMLRSQSSTYKTGSSTTFKMAKKLV